MERSSTDSTQSRIAPPVWPPHGPFGGNGPYWPYPPFSAGEIHGMFVALLAKAVEETRAQKRTFRDAIDELAAGGQISRHDIAHLYRLAKLVETESDDMRLMASMHRLRLEMVTGGDVPLVAHTIISIGIDSLGGAVGNPQARGIFKADLDGAATGAGIGALVGGAAGAGVGALAGGIGCSLAAWLDTRKGA